MLGPGGTYLRVGRRSLELHHVSESARDREIHVAALERTIMRSRSARSGARGERRRGGERLSGPPEPRVAKRGPDSTGDS